MALESRMYVGLDVGGSSVKGARVDAEGNIAERLQQAVVRTSGEALLAQLEEVVRGLSGDEPSGHVSGVGIGLPGIVDRTSRVRVAPTLPVLNGVSVGEELTRRLGVRVTAENDANAAALAEALRGAGRGADNVLYLTVGTGVGAGLVLGGRIWSGRQGYAGEIGHIQVDPEGVPCGCGSRGCLETVAGAPGWVRRAQALLASRDSSLKGRGLDAMAIAEAAFEDDPVALEVMEGAARALAVGIAAALDLLDIERVVIGGGVATSGRFLLDRIVEETRRRTFPQIFEACTFRLAELGEDAGIVGAACVAVLAEA
jgi:glucokinase